MCFGIHSSMHTALPFKMLRYVNASVDIFFSKEMLSTSCAKGIEKTGANSLIVQAIIGKCKPLVTFFIV